MKIEAQDIRRDCFCKPSSPDNVFAFDSGTNNSGTVPLITAIIFLWLAEPPQKQLQT
jgi:hypothetical protein